MKRLFIPLLIIFMIHLVHSQSYLSGKENSNEKMRLIVMDLTPKNVSRSISIAITDMLRSEMVDTNRFEVLERNQMNTILREQEFQQTGCTDNKCAVEMGKILSARKVLIGEVNQLGASTIITVRTVDVETGLAEFSTSEKAGSINEVDTASKKLVSKLTLRITGQRPVGETGPTRTGFYLRGLAPGWGQIYAGRTMKGKIFLGSFLLAGGILGYSYWDYSDKKDQYMKLQPGESKEIYDSRYSEYNRAGKVMVFSLVLTGLVYLANITDVLFFTDAPDSVAFRSSETSAISFNIISPPVYMGNQNPGGINIYLAYSLRF